MYGLPNYLKPWKAGGFKVWDFITDGWPLDSTEINLHGYAGATLPEWLSRCTSVQTLNLQWCRSLTALPDLSALTSLQTLNLMFCDSLTALPDLSALTDLKVERLPKHLRPWKAGGFKAWDFITDGWPLDSTEIDLYEYGGAILPEWLSRCTRLQTLNLGHCYSLTALPDLSALKDLKVYELPNHLKPWKAGGFKAWKSGKS